MASQVTHPDLERGISYKVDGKYDEAIGEFRSLVADDPNCSDAHHQLGLVYGFTGMFDESLEALRRAVTLTPGRVDIRNDLALTYSMLGMYEEARMEFEEVLQREPNNEKALKNLQFFTDPS